MNGEGKISGSYVSESNGSSVWAEDGKLKLELLKTLKNGTIRLRKKPTGYDDAKGVTLVYQKSGSQKVGKNRD